MPIDPRRLKPTELVRLLNSTPLGEVISERQLHRHRSRAGFRIGDGRTVDLLRYVAWLVIERHRPRPEPEGLTGYEAHKERAAQRNREMALLGRDIATGEWVHPPRNPEQRQRAERDFRFFCEAYFPQTFHLPWSPDHLKVIAKIERAVLEGGLFAMAMPRGSGKTSLCEVACLWALVYGHREFVALIGSDEEHAASMLDSIKVELETNDLLEDDFAEVVRPDGLADRILDRHKHPPWQGERTKMVSAFPADEALWIRYTELWREGMRAERGIGEATEFYRRHREQMDDGAAIAWPERLTDATVGREWRSDDAPMVRIDRCLIDVNWGQSSDVVYQFCRQSRYAAVVMPSHGRYVRASGIPFSDYKRKRGDRVGLNWRIVATATRRTVRHVVFDTNYWKSFVHARLAVPMGDPGCLSLFGRSPESHRLLADHLTAEYFVHTEGRGRTVDEWRLRLPAVDNHWLDCLVGCAVVASLVGSALPGVAGAPRPQRKRVSLAELYRRARAQP